MNPTTVVSAPTVAARNPYLATEALVDQAAEVFAGMQSGTARLWRLVDAMYSAAGERECEFVADQLALLMNVHPRTARTIVITAVQACRIPSLMTAFEAGELTDRHVSGVLEEVVRWAPGDQAQQAAVVELALARVRAQVERGSSWPAPGVLRRKVHAAALLLDLTAVEKRKKDAVERRGVFAVLTGPGEASLSITGPDFRVGRMMDAIRARAHALGRLPGDTRTLEQRMFDAADELLGSTAEIPSTDEAGDPVAVSPRPTELQVLVPYSVLQGGDLELAELPGLGPILPSTARELLAEATSLRRVAIDAGTGHVLAVDDRIPLPRTAREVLDRLVSTPVQLRDLSSDAYRIPGRVARFVRARDRVCVFPGCTTPARWTDLDHREHWPLGPTAIRNLHCLCRHHHRAKQAVFTVTQDPDGSTVWTTRDGHQYRSPPPTY